MWWQRRRAVTATSQLPRALGVCQDTERRAALPTDEISGTSQPALQARLLECGVSHGGAGIQMAEAGVLTSLRLCLVGCAENAAQRDGVAVPSAHGFL